MKTFSIAAILCVLGVSFALAQSGTIKNPDPQPSAEFVRYHGPQLSLTARGAKIDRRFPLPVYFGLPARPYQIIGSVIIHGTTRADPIDEALALRSAVMAAKLHGADAIVMQPLSERARRAMWGKGPEIFAHAAAIKWGVPERRPTGLTF